MELLERHVLGVIHMGHLAMKLFIESHLVIPHLGMVWKSPGGTYVVSL